MLLYQYLSLKREENNDEKKSNIENGDSRFNPKMAIFYSKKLKLFYKRRNILELEKIH